MKPIARHMVALTSMVFGGVGVFAVVYAMNAAEQPPKTESEASAVNFNMEPKPPPKKKKKEPKPRKPKPTPTRTAPRAPLPSLSASLTGASFDLPAFEQAGLTEVDRSLLGDTGKKMVMTEGALDSLPTPLRRVQPRFPDKARKRGIQGYVKMSVFINERGGVEQVRILDALPRGVFEQAAEDAIRSWEFNPGEYGGEQVSTWITQTFRFELQKAT